MKEFVYTCLLKDDPEIIRQYKDYHAAVWPEVVASLRATGVQTLRIYLLGRRVCMIVQTADDYDPAAATRQHWQTHPRVRAWEELMRSFQERPPEAPPGDGTWVALDCICTL